jgi:hypothetical protein
MTSHGAHAPAEPKARWLPPLLQPAARSRWVLIVSSVVAFCGLTAAGVYVTAGGSPGPAHQRPLAYSSPNPDTTEPAPQFHVPAPVAPVALPSTGAIPMPYGAQPQVQTWKAGRGGKALGAVTSQAGAVAQASGQKQYVEMRQACSALATSVASAQTAPAIPAAAMQAKYQQALSELATAAAQCQAGISEQPDGDEYVATTQNPADLKASAAALAAGSNDLYQATGQISDLGQGQ